MLRKTWKRCLTAAILMGGSLVAANPTHAGLLPVSADAKAMGAGYKYTYGVVLTSDSKLNPGDFFTLFDFKGFVPGSSMQPADFTFSSAMTGGNASQTVPNDDPTLPNLTWTYTGTSALEGQVGLGDFSVISTNGPIGNNADFSSMTHSSSTTDPEKNVTSTLSPGDAKTVPGNGTPPPAPPGVPEPSAMILAGLGLPVLSLYLIRRRRLA